MQFRTDLVGDAGLEGLFRLVDGHNLFDALAYCCLVVLCEGAGGDLGQTCFLDAHFYYIKIINFYIKLCYYSVQNILSNFY